jgi:hypothetical protein
MVYLKQSVYFYKLRFIYFCSSGLPGVLNSYYHHKRVNRFRNSQSCPIVRVKGVRVIVTGVDSFTLRVVIKESLFVLGIPKIGPWHHLQFGTRTFLFHSCSLVRSLVYVLSVEVVTESKSVEITDEVV